jgi:hypothetical protein
MAGNPQVLGLLEEMLDSGKTPEEVCRNCPELLDEVRQRWMEFRLIDAEVGALLPEPGSFRDAEAIPPVPPAAGIRARDALARLPVEERKQWERLWSDVDALLRRVSQPE